jgi:predicted ATP-dependent protease
VQAEHVTRALTERFYRSDLTRQRLERLIAEGTILVDVSGEVVGQVNGLSVYNFGDIAFGRPLRITATTFAGRGGVTNIERESKLSGRIHDKGVLILTGYLGSKYAQEGPLTLSAAVCFEQSYEGVEGDSASSAELYAILSSLAELPIRQDLAVTGSVNQKGEIQPVSGINEKIEGFFDLCKAVGLTGEQGVIIPRRNIRNLMLRDDVVQATQDGSFNIYAVDTVDEGIELLTGVPAGERQIDGTYPISTVGYYVKERLQSWTQGLKWFSDGVSST